MIEIKSEWVGTIYSMTFTRKLICKSINQNRLLDLFESKKYRLPVLDAPTKKVIRLLYFFVIYLPNDMLRNKCWNFPLIRQAKKKVIFLFVWAINFPAFNKARVSEWESERETLRKDIKATIAIHHRGGKNVFIITWL